MDKQSDIKKIKIKKARSLLIILSILQVIIILVSVTNEQNMFTKIINSQGDFLGNIFELIGYFLFFIIGLINYIIVYSKNK